MRVFKVSYDANKTAFPIETLSIKGNYSHFSENNELENLIADANNSFKLTDLMSYSYKTIEFFIISEKMKKIIESNYGSMKSFDLKFVLMKHKGKEYKYYLLNFHYDWSNDIIYDKVKFMLYNIIKEKIILAFNVNSKEEFKYKRSKKSGLNKIVIEDSKLLLNSNKFTKNNLFRFEIYRHHFFISEKLKEKFEQEKVTGIFINKKSVNFEYDTIS